MKFSVGDYAIVGYFPLNTNYTAPLADVAQDVTFRGMRQEDWMVNIESVTFRFFKIDKNDISVKSHKNKKQFFKNDYNLEFKCKGYLIYPVLARLCIHCQIINTSNSKE